MPRPAKEKQEVVVYAAPEESNIKAPVMNFAEDFRQYVKPTLDELDNYLQKEIEKLEAMDAPVLSSVLACGHSLAKTRALIILSADPRYKAFRVKLVEGVTPPDRDYNGALLPAAKRGKVLAAKIGLTSQFDVRSHGRANEGVAQQKYGAKASLTNEKVAKKQYLYSLGRYAHIEISSERESIVDFDSAVAIIQRYGWGVAPKESMWMVQEL